MNSYRRPFMTLGHQFHNLYFSSHDLVNRFGVEQDVEAGLRKFLEESVELGNALGNQDPNEIAEEAVDVMVTLINLLRPAGVSTALLVETMKKVWEKNDSKTDLTHVVHKGLITRRSKLESKSD